MTATLNPTESIATDAVRPSGAGFVTGSLVVAKRTLTAFARTPQLLVVATIQGAMFLLIFRYVFGGAIGETDGVRYVDFMVPGFIVAGVLFSGRPPPPGWPRTSSAASSTACGRCPSPAPHWRRGGRWRRRPSSRGASS
jgi:hypothetical protein